MADSTQFTVDIDVPIGGTTAAADAMANLVTRLEAAGAASSAAAEAVKAGEAAYSQAEKAASRAALAVEKIGLSADAQRGKLQAALAVGDSSGADRATAALDRLTQRQAEASAKAEAAKAALSGEAATLDRLRAAATQAAAAQEEISKAHKQTSDAAKATNKASQQAAANFGKTNEIAEGLGKLGGPAGQAGQKIFGLAEGFKKLGSSLGAAGPYVAVAVAVIAIATAAIVATAAVVAWTVSLSDAASTQSRLFQGMVQSVAGGQALEASVARLASRVPLTNDKLKSMASELAKTGLRGKELEDALESAAVKASEAEFGPEWAKQVNSLDKQAEIFKSHMTGLFRLKTDALQAGLARLVALFDETSATGKAIKVVFDSLLQPLIDGLVSLIPTIVKTFIQFEIWALKALIAIKPYGSTIATVAKGLGVVAAVIGGVLVAALVIVIGVAALFLTRVALIWTALIGVGRSLVEAGESAYAFGASIMGGAGGALDWLSEKFTGVIDWLKSLSLSDIGSDLILGLAQGLLGGGPSVLQAITGVVDGAIDAAKNLLGIASPSKVFAEIGANTAAGMTEGVDGGVGDVQGSLAAMVTPPTDGQALASPAASSSTSSGHNMAGATFNFYGVKDAQDAVDKFIAFLEGDVDQLGAGEPA